MEGGSGGARGEIRVNDGAPFERSDRADLALGDRVILRQPGGGGFGPAEERDPAAVDADLRDGYISSEMAESAYRVALTADRKAVDHAATRSLRAGLAIPAS
jgi:N-methylhydantoinase B